MIETPTQAARHRLLAAVLERVGRTTADLVLRGGMLTRGWVAPHPRPTRDLDYVGDYPFDVAGTVARFRPALALELDDGIAIDRERLAARAIWADTAFPGVHLEIALGFGAPDQSVTVDVGFGDPLVPPATTWNGARAVRAETQLAWKLHCLAEMQLEWRPKDLADLYLIATRVPLVAEDLPVAIEAAFASRGFPLSSARVLDAPHWATKSARARWAGSPVAATIGTHFPEVVAEVRERLAPALDEVAA